MSEQLLKAKEAAKFLSISVSTLYEYAKRPDFPRKRKIGERAGGWWMSELKEWVERQNKQQLDKITQTSA